MNEDLIFINEKLVSFVLSSLCSLVWGYSDTMKEKSIFHNNVSKYLASQRYVPN